MKSSKIIAVATSIATMFASFGAVSYAKANSEHKIKNIIYMIPDGGGMSPFYMADAVKVAGGLGEAFPYATKTEKGNMFMKDYLVGAIVTSCAEADTVTDSAAAGTALATGYKANVGNIGLDSSLKPQATILEMCQKLGMKTGMATTYDWANATPATFSSHNESRSNNGILSEQITNQDIDVILGVGFDMAGWGGIYEAEKRGYSIVNNREELQKVKKGDKIWGNIEKREFPYDIDNTSDTVTLKEMTEASIKALSDADEDGFFLMVEGSRVDGAGHGNNEMAMVGDFLAFDEAFGVALKYAQGRDDTIVIACPDHDTGGMLLPEDLTKAVADIQGGNNSDDVNWTSTHHTDQNGGLFIYLPEGVDYPEGIDPTAEKPYESNVIDNTAIAPYLASLLGVSPTDMTKDLFVDVTDMGTFDKFSKLFSFNDYSATVKQNAAYAFYNGNTIDLGGEVCVLANERFYVPQKLLDILQGKEAPVVCPYEAPVSPHVEMSMNLQNEAGVQVNLKNYLKQDVKGYVKFTAPENLAKVGNVDFSLSALETKAFDFECENINKDGCECDYEIVLDNGNKYSFTQKIDGILYAAYTDYPIVVDGIIDEAEWEKAPKVVCDDASMLVDIVNWKGFRDLSSVFSMLYDDENLYFYSTVTDELFWQDKKPNNMWEADCIQFGFYNDVDGLYAAQAAGSKYDGINFGYLENQPVAYRSRCSTDLLTKDTIIENGVDGFEFQCVHDINDLTYEIKIPWKVLFGYELNPKSGDMLAFSYLVNDNDGEGRRGCMQYGGGIYGGKDVNKFVKLYLINPDEPIAEAEEPLEPGLKIFYNGKKLPFENKLFIDIENNRTFVPAEEFLKGAGFAYEKNDAGIISAEDIKIQTGEVLGDATVQNIDGVCYIPVRAFCEKIGATVGWEQDTLKVLITK